MRPTKTLNFVGLSLEVSLILPLLSERGFVCTLLLLRQMRNQLILGTLSMNETLAFLLVSFAVDLRILPGFGLRDLSDASFVASNAAFLVRIQFELWLSSAVVESRTAVTACMFGETDLGFAPAELGLMDDESNFIPVTLFGLGNSQLECFIVLGAGICKYVVLYVMLARK